MWMEDNYVYLPRTPRQGQGKYILYICVNKPQRSHVILARPAIDTILLTNLLSFGQVSKLNLVSYFAGSEKINVLLSVAVSTSS